MNYLEIANSPILYLVTFIILGILVTQGVLFFFMARKRAKELNIEDSVIKKAVKAGVITTILPSVAVVIGLISLAPALGIPISWARLGMAGSMMYELTAASVGAQAMGTTLGSATYTGQAFANSVWMMSIGVVPAFIYGILLLRKYKTSIKKAVSKDNTTQNIILGTILVTVQVSFVVPAVMGGSSSLMAVIVAALIMTLLLYLIGKKGFKALREYALSISMLTAVVVVILANIN